MKKKHVSKVNLRKETLSELQKKTRNVKAKINIVISYNICLRLICSYVPLIMSVKLVHEILSMLFQRHINVFVKI